MSYTPKVAALVIALGLTIGLSSPLAQLLSGNAQAEQTLQAATRKAPAKKPAAKPAAAATKPADLSGDFATVSPMDLLKEPDKYMNKKIVFEGTFNRFSDTGLDYKKAFRDSRDYVGLFIYRPDVTAHKIPMSELKLFFPRKKSEDVLTLDSGDTIRIKGQVFNTALSEPWVDILELKIIEKSKEKAKKPPEECC